MNLLFKKLTPDLANDYLYYFDNVAFTDHEEFSMCYCLESHVSKEDDDRLITKESRRQKAYDLIIAGTMQGFLLYDNNAVIGWCNFGDKKSYCSVMDKEHETLDVNRNKIMVLYCMEIAPAYRGKGIAHEIVNEVCTYAKEAGYDYVEAYPFLDESFAYQFHGPRKLFDKHGFECISSQTWFCIMRKKL